MRLERRVVLRGNKLCDVATEKVLIEDDSEIKAVVVCDGCGIFNVIVDNDPIIEHSFKEPGVYRESVCVRGGVKNISIEVCRRDDRRPVKFWYMVEINGKKVVGIEDIIGKLVGVVMNVAWRKIAGE